MEIIIVILIVLLAVILTAYKLWKMASGKDESGCAGCMNKAKCAEKDEVHSNLPPDN